MGAVQPFAGRLELDGVAVCFVPRFPFEEGIEYALLWRAASGSLETLGTLRRPTLEGAPTSEVLEIYPTASSVPVTLLKIYVQFSAPMSEGWAARAIEVRRTDTGEPLRDVFLPGDLELWSRDRARLTLLLDPGRIKRGLAPHQRLSYPLIEGVPITISVGTKFRDAGGNKLRAPADRRYEVGSAVRTPLDPGTWECATPTAGSRDRLTVTFDRALDRALVDRCLTVLDDNAAPLPGRVSVGREERTWYFEPLAPWQPTPYSIRVDPRLEDLAGNSLRRVFDRDLANPSDVSPNAQTTIEFRCLPASPPSGVARAIERA